MSNRTRRTVRRGSRTRGETDIPLLFCDDARQLALDVLAEVAGEEIGEHLGVTSPQQGLAIHRFASITPGYRGWEWVVVLSSVPDARDVREITVNEATLQAGKKATLAPEWVPYEERVRPGDLRPGDVLPPRADDDRLAEWRELNETGDGGAPRNPRSDRTLSQTGLSAALGRWRSGNFGPSSAYARQAEHECRSCAFFLPLGSVDTGVGACTNEFSADGRIVAEDYGCGAHSASEDDAVERGKGYEAFDDGLGVDRW